MYELLVLSLLLHWPSLHGYLLAEIANSIIGPHEQISRGTLSSLLTRLEQGGMITRVDPEKLLATGDRPSRAFAITEAGRKRFYELMMDTTSYQGGYQRIFRIKALHLEFIPQEDRILLVNHYIKYCQAGLHYQKTRAQDFVTDPVKQEPVSNTFQGTALSLMDLIANQWQLELEWAEHLLKRIKGIPKNEHSHL